MGNLYPSGSRLNAGNRIFGAAAIHRATRSKNHDSDGSIADKPHANSREIERRLRQQARREQTNGN